MDRIGPKAGLRRDLGLAVPVSESRYSATLPVNFSLSQRVHALMASLPRLLPVVVVLVGAAFAAAQDFQLGPALDLGTLGVTVAQGEATKQMFGRYARPGSSPSSRARASRAGASALAYRPSPAVRKRVLDNFVAVITRNDPKTEAAVRREIAKADPMRKMDAQIRAYGLRPNDFGDGMAVYLVQAWYGAHGKVASGSAVYKAVARQAAEVFGANPVLVRASDATKQEAAEGMVLYAALFEDAVVQAKKDPASLAKVKAAVAAHARNSLGFDLAALRLGPNGLY